MSRIVRSRDGTPIADFVSGEDAGPPVVLVHGAAADHTTFRVVGPLLARRFEIHAIDRRGRGASGDAASYSVEREFEDVAAVADDLAETAGQPVAVVGHSFGGRVGLGAALLTANIGRLVVYEGAPSPPSETYQPEGLLRRLSELRDRGRNDELLSAFLREVVGMGEAELEGYRANPVWPARVAAAPTIVRELEAESSAAAGLDALARVPVPVLQLLGGESRAVFGQATRALDERLRDGRVFVIAGARHAAHHTHPAEFIRAVEEFISGEPAAP